jgi:hypothetical protein
MGVLLEKMAVSLVFVSVGILITNIAGNRISVYKNNDSLFWLGYSFVIVAGIVLII